MQIRRGTWLTGRRLRGFQRVALKAGESFTLTTDDVGSQVEPGTIEVYVGDSSKATLTSTFTVG